MVDAPFLGVNLLLDVSKVLANGSKNLLDEELVLRFLKLSGSIV